MKEIIKSGLGKNECKTKEYVGKRTEWFPDQKLSGSYSVSHWNITDWLHKINVQMQDSVCQPPRNIWVSVRLNTFSSTSGNQGFARTSVLILNTPSAWKGKLILGEKELLSKFVRRFSYSKRLQTVEVGQPQSNSLLRRNNENGLPHWTDLFRFSSQSYGVKKSTQSYFRTLLNFPRCIFMGSADFMGHASSEIGLLQFKWG